MNKRKINDNSNMSRKRLQYEETDMAKALTATKIGMPIRTAARTYGVPRSTLRDKFAGIIPEERSAGSKPVLTDQEEKSLAAWIIHCAEKGFPITKKNLLDSIQMILNKDKRKNPFVDNRPGRAWYHGFLNRNRNVSQRITQNLTKSRASVSKEQLENWFKEVGDYLKSKGLEHIDSRRIFNCDETAFFLSPKGEKVLAKKGSKAVHSIINTGEKENLTALFMASAAGELAPPMVLYAYERLPAEITSTFPRGWGIGKSPTGWQNGKTFFEYIANIFYPHLVKTGIEFPVLLFVDGHKSHITIQLSEFCTEKKIELIVLFPNATHILQPLDVAFFHVLKSAWMNHVLSWRMQNFGFPLKQKHFAGLLEKTVSSIKFPEILKNGFRACGLHPFSSAAIHMEKVFAKKSSNSSDRVSTEQRMVSKLTPAQCAAFQDFIEDQLPTNMLENFKSIENQPIPVWNGPLQFEQLFYTWLKLQQIKKRPAALEDYHFVSVDSVEEIAPVISQEENVFDDESTSKSNVIEIDNLHQEAELPKTAAEPDLWVLDVDGDGTVNRLKPFNEEFPNEEVKLLDKYDKNQSSSAIVDFQSVKGLVSKNNLLQFPLILHEKSPNVPQEFEPQTIQISNEIPSSKSAAYDSSTIKSHVPGGIPPIFRETLFWPIQEDKPKKGKPGYKVPSVATSDEWQEYHKQKIAEKERVEKEKEQRKQMRIVNKKIKQEKLEEQKAERAAKRQQKQAELTAKKNATKEKRRKTTAKKNAAEIDTVNKENAGEKNVSETNVATDNAGEKHDRKRKLK